MNRTKNWIIGLLVVFSFSYCDDNSKTAEELTREENELKEQIILKEIVDKYDVKYRLDTLRRYYFTCDFEDLLNTKYQIIKRYDVFDIYRKSGIYYAEIRIWGYKHKILKLKMSDGDKETMLGLNRNKTGYVYRQKRETALVVSLNDIKKVDFSIQRIDEGDDYYQMEIESAEGFIGSGELIAIYQW